MLVLFLEIFINMVLNGDSTMNVIFLMLYITFFGSVINYEFSGINQKSCMNNDSCLSINQTERTGNYGISDSSAPQDFMFENLTDNLSKGDIYFVPGSDQSIGNAAVKVQPAVDFQEENTTIKQDQVFPGSTENINFSTLDEVEQHIATDITEFVESTKKEFFSSTLESKITEGVSTTTAKSKISTTEKPNTATHSVFSQNLKKNKNICFCDLLVNECDINCCCDKDCSLSHFKVFTKCIDNTLYDSKYCYKTNFIFANNTYHKIIQSNGGLFCIVKENVDVGLKYESKEALTSLELFNKSMPAKLYVFSYKSKHKLDFINTKYTAGSPVWTVQNGELVPFRILYSSVGLLCNAEQTMQYLVDQVKSCFYHQQQESHCETTKLKEVIHQLKGIKIISNPVSLNKSELVNSSMICRTNKCIGINSYLCLSVNSAPYCTKVLENSKRFENDCWSALSHVQYKIWHNGTEGIIKVEAYLWVRKLQRTSSELLQLRTEVEYKWAGLTKKIFRRSGNPGYLTGKPILAGRKIYNTHNETFGKKEAIELSLNPKDWLSVLGSEKGICSSSERSPIYFRENSKNMCSLKLSRYNFSKENCGELQNNIFKLLIGNEILNETKENYFNKFVATFGNSKVEETGDWVQVLIDLFPISSSQTYFKPNHYQVMCKNIITDLYIYIVYSNIGSFLAPQAKILGVSFQFGKHRDLIFNCDTPGCENTALVRYFKLSTAVHFVDVTKPAVDAFAEPLSLEVKLPHDFFYPFFSKSYKSQFLSKYVIILLLSTFF